MRVYVHRSGKSQYVFTLTTCVCCFLSSQGVTTEQLQQIVSKQATVLNLNVEDNLKPKAAYLTDTMVSPHCFWFELMLLRCVLCSRVCSVDVPLQYHSL
jgi:hypothetical protein